MHRQTRVGLVVAVGLVLATVWVGAQAKDPFIGTWVLNAAKSKYSPGPAPTSQTSTYEAAGSGYKVTVRRTPANGAMLEWSYTTNLDGKPVAVTGNNPDADMIAVTRIDATTLEQVNTRNGKETTRQRNVVAADGKTRTITTTGVDGQGRKVNNVSVWDKK